MYCSRKCSESSQVKYNDRKCVVCGKVFRPINELNKYCSRDCYIKDYKPWNKGNGNLSSYQRFKNDKKHKDWRIAVFERDNYTCQICGQKGGKLNADHIKPYAIYPKLRLELSNGRTLCEKCHRETPTYGGRVIKLKKAICNK